MAIAYHKCVRLQEAAEEVDEASLENTASGDVTQRSVGRVSSQGLRRQGTESQLTDSQGPSQGLGSADVMPTEEQLPGQTRRREAAKPRPVKCALSLCSMSLPPVENIGQSKIVRSQR